jgi:type IV pilus assembly protein PilV
MLMNARPAPPLTQAGFSMIEVLVALIILLVGLLGLAGLMVQSQRSEMESYQRVQALILLEDMQSRINANRNVAACYAFTTGTAGSPFVGVGGAVPAAGACATGTAVQNSQVHADLVAWDALLKGAAEQTGGGTVNVGAMTGARGCVSYDGSTGNLLRASDGNTIPGTGIYTLAVAWQGLADTSANTTVLCGTGLYGAETKRRVASVTFRIGAVNNTN